MSSRWKELTVGLWLLAVLCTTVWAESDSSLDEEWKHWKKTHKKKYQNEVEEMSRRALWEQNLMEINAHNLEASQGLHTYTKGLNEMSDMTEDEFMEFASCVMIPEDFEMTPTPLEDTDDALPASVDWVTAGYVTSVKHQSIHGKCGSCWAFTTAGALEGLLVKNKQPLTDLSPQNLMDCATDPKYKCNGCNGGNLGGALQYVIDKQGINSEADYPYKGPGGGTCVFNNKKIAAKCSSFTRVASTEAELQNAVATVGPIAAAINSSDIMNYKKGVFSSPTCSKTPDHAVLVVGYGTEGKEDYWLIKNSWGANWGENGYLKLARNKNQMCGISTFAYFPII